jgi:hypothetical protein
MCPQIKKDHKWEKEYEVIIDESLGYPPKYWDSAHDAFDRSYSRKKPSYEGGRGRDKDYDFDYFYKLEKKDPQTAKEIKQKWSDEKRNCYECWVEKFKWPGEFEEVYFGDLSQEDFEKLGWPQRKLDAFREWVLDYTAQEQEWLASQEEPDLDTIHQTGDEEDGYC